MPVTWKKKKNNRIQQTIWSKRKHEQQQNPLFFVFFSFTVVAVNSWCALVKVKLTRFWLPKEKYLIFILNGLYSFVLYGIFIYLCKKKKLKNICFYYTVSDFSFNDYKIALMNTYIYEF